MFSHVAATIAGKTYGIAKKANVIAVKCLGDDGTGPFDDIALCVEWIANRARQTGRKSIVNMSIAGKSSRIINDAIEAATAMGIFFVVAAGNNGTPASCMLSPANSRDVLSVGASNILDKKAWFSNFGTCTHIFAPGENITSAYKGTEGNEKYTMSGSSMA
jgi:subtilisin family serine protease